MLNNRLTAVATLALAVALGACTGAGAGATPSPTSAAPTTTPTTAPTADATPTVATLTPATATPEASGPAACPFAPIGYSGAPTMRAPSDRLVNVLATSGATEDTLTFVFQLKGPASPSGATPTVRMKEAKPPFTSAGSGAKLDVKGDRHIQVVFDGMTLAEEDGSDVFTGGPLDLGKFTGLRDVVQYDAFEGVSGWIVGLSDSVCVKAGLGAPNEVVLTITHG